MEAMAAGRPVLCLDLAGPAEIVAHNAGVKVRAISPEQAVTDLARALSRLAMDDSFRQSLADCGRHTVCEQFSWVQKRQRVLAYYEQTVGTAQHREQAIDAKASVAAFPALGSEVADEPGAVGEGP